MLHFLCENTDIFASSAKDMPGIAREVAEHQLSILPNAKPVCQKKRKIAPERQVTIKEEVAKLLQTGFIKSAKYPEWLANVVMVKKSNGKWSMRIDFTDLNTAFPKDPFPLPRIDQLIDTTAGHELLNFMDAYFSYNQIMMAPEDVQRTSFITDKCIYFYKVMSFGLKNTGATYQRMVNKVFTENTRRNMEVYVDDILVKNMKATGYI